MLTILTYFLLASSSDISPKSSVVYMIYAVDTITKMVSGEVLCSCNDDYGILLQLYGIHPTRWFSLSYITSLSNIDISAYIHAKKQVMMWDPKTNALLGENVTLCLVVSYLRWDSHLLNEPPYHPICRGIHCHYPERIRRISIWSDSTSSKL